MKSVKAIIFLLFSFFSALAIAQTDTLSVADKIDKAESYFRFNYDNDFFSATDRYYTQGICIELIMPFIKKSPLSKLLIPLKNASLNYYGICFQQDGFTPRSIRHDSIYFGERPYASVFFVSHFLTSINKENKQRLNTSLYLGVIGPNAKGEEEQKAIHSWLDNIQPLGWEYQIANDFVVNYNLRFEQGFIGKKHFEFVGYAGGRLGTLYDDVNAGLILRAGWMDGYFESLGQRFSLKKYVAESVEGKTSEFKCHFFSKGELKAVVYNATLQGGMFNTKSIYTIPSEDISRIVATAYAGVVLSYKRVSLEYAKAYISPEFRGGLPHGWGHCNITVCF